MVLSYICSAHATRRTTLRSRPATLRRPGGAGIAVRGTDPGEVTTLGEGAHVGRPQLVDNRVDHHQEREVSGGGDA